MKEIKDKTDQCNCAEPVAVVLSLVMAAVTCAAEVNPEQFIKEPEVNTNRR